MRWEEPITDRPDVAAERHRAAGEPAPALAPPDWTAENGD